MKKLWTLGFALSLALAGCGQSEENAVTGGEETTENEATEEVNIKGELMDFYLNLTITLNGIDTGINDYEAALAGEAPPTGEELVALEEAAVASATEVAEAISTLEIPEALSDVAEDIETFKTTLAESYSMKAEELQKEGEANLEEANGKFVEAEGQIGSILEEAGLTAPSLNTDLNG